MQINRRQFGALAGAAGLSAGMGGFPRLAFAQGAPDASQIITGKSPEMIVLNAKLGVMETPISLLRKHSHTPKEILFNRLHFPHEGNAAWYGTTAAPFMPIIHRIDPKDVVIGDREAGVLKSHEYDVIEKWQISREPATCLSNVRAPPSFSSS